MATITVKTNDLTNTAEEFDLLSTNINKTGNEMLALVKKFDQNVWTGNAKNKYTGKFAKLSDDLENMKKHITNYVNNLKTAADYYTGTESNNADLTSNLKTDVIQ